MKLEEKKQLPVDLTKSYSCQKHWGDPVNFKGKNFSFRACNFSIYLIFTEMTKPQLKEFLGELQQKQKELEEIVKVTVKLFDECKRIVNQRQNVSQ